MLVAVAAAESGGLFTNVVNYYIMGCHTLADQSQFVQSFAAHPSRKPGHAAFEEINKRRRMLATCLLEEVGREPEHVRNAVLRMSQYTA